MININNFPNLSNEKNYNIYNFREFKLYNNNIPYNIKIIINNDKLIFRLLNYELQLNKEEISALINMKFNTINDAFQFIIKHFIQGNIKIKEIYVNKIIKLNVILNDEKFNIKELNLVHNNINKDFIINELCNEYNNKYNTLVKEISELKERLNIINNEMEKKKLKKIDNENNDELNKKNELKTRHIFNNFKLKLELTKNSYCFNYIFNTFIIFQSVNNIMYLVYATYNKSIISYNLYSEKIELEIKNAHKNYILNFRHCFDKKNKRDLIISISDIDNHIKLWDANIWECILILENINKSGFLNSACFLIAESNIHIISSNWNFNNIENIKVFDIKGNKIKEMNDSNDKTVYIKSFYDYKNLKNYIITGNDGFIKSYDYQENKTYNKYNIKNARNSYYYIIIKYFKNILKLICSCFDGYIRIWEFNTGEIINIIYACKKGVIGMALLDDKYIFCGNNDKILEVIDIENGKILNKFNGLNEIFCTIKKIKHPKYGDCLITQGFYNDQIKLWSFNE